jgi:hypothetical protein
MKLVIIESPLSASTREGIEENKKYARQCMHDSLLRGEAPFATHLLYDQPGILNDTIPSERERGIQAGFAWGAQADFIAVYIDRGISSGMLRGVIMARARGLDRRKIEIRALHPNTKIPTIDELLKMCLDVHV